MSLDAKQTNQQTHIPANSGEAVSPDQEPIDILREFQQNAGTDCDLVGEATITDVTEHELQLRIDRTITAKESQHQRTISYPSYRGGLTGRIPFNNRYDKIPAKVNKLYSDFDTPTSGWVDQEATAELKFQENSGCSPSQCSRCNGSGQKDCRDCNSRGREACPRCSDSSVRKKGYVGCSTCNGDGTIECSNCDSWGKVRNDDWEKETCPKCGGDADWPCDHCGGSGRERCPNHCNDGKITCRSCGGSQKVDCTKCDTSGKTVDVTHGDITYEFTEKLYMTDDIPVDPSLLLSLDLKCISIAGDVSRLPGGDALLDSKGNPRSEATTVADVSLSLETPMIQLTYKYGTEEYELYKVGDLIFFDKIPLKNPTRVRAVTIATGLLLTLGATLAVLGQDFLELIQGVIA